MEYKHTLNFKKVEYLIGLKENPLISNFNKIYYNSLANIIVLHKYYRWSF